VIWSLGVCLAELNEHREAVERWSWLVDRFREFVQDEGRAELANDLATSHLVRALASRAHRGMDDARLDLAEASRLLTDPATPKTPHDQRLFELAERLSEAFDTAPP